MSPGGGFVETIPAVGVLTSSSLGGLVRNLRQQVGMSQRLLAEQSGLSMRTLREIEQDRVLRPRAVSLQRLAEVLNEPQLCARARARGSRLACSPDETSEFSIRLLGPFAALRGSVELDIGTPQQRHLLALLTLRANHAVHRTEIVDVLWGEEPPYSFQQLVHTHVSRLRGFLDRHRSAELGTPSIIRRPEGYQLCIDRDQLDLLRFQELAGKAELARRNGDVPSEQRVLSQLVQMHTGELLEGFGERLRAHPAVADYYRLHLAATLRLADLAIDAGQYDEAIPRLQQVQRAHPLHEGLHSRLMVALAGSGQQVAALALYTELETMLRKEFGIEPSAELRAAHLTVLGQGALPIAVGTATRPAHRQGTASPSLLPYEPEDFVGRSEHHPVLRQLTKSRSPAALGLASVVSLYGPAAAGKSVLAIRTAYASRPHFPGGQLYVDLRGHTPEPVPAQAALSEFLQALGVAEKDLPSSLSGRVALYRSLLSDRRALVVLDNVADEEHARPLMPGGFNSSVLLTSREPLVALEDARHFRIPSFTTEQARELLARITGRHRTSEEPAAADEIVELCEALPLAIRIVGLRLAMRPHWTLAHMAQRLRDEDHRLDALAQGALAVRPRLEAGLGALAPADRRALHDLAGAVENGFSTDLAAAELKCSVQQADSLLERLTDQQLIEPADAADDTYRFSPLIRLYAREPQP
ncbi:MULTISPECIES: BTAD domain-containing putative transcriptional regulator [unclassified Streptomyces]|uniref:BTAD domain-containing putative transcriptional regulator n=1 Tax=unclassified Streptomyces TaxID=2593676 RepID=UPI00381490C9